MSCENLMNMTTHLPDSRIASVSILGVKIDPVDIAYLHSYMAEVIEKNKHALIIHVNVYGLNLAYKFPWLRQFYNDADLTVCDGAGLILGGRILGETIPQRITYMDWIWELADFVQRNGYSCFFLGGYPHVADKAAAHLQTQFPKLKIVGTHHGYFDKTRDSRENQAVIQEINAVKPDILFVGLGMPNQEKWFLENWPDVKANIGLGPGALFDYLSGDVPRSPRWMTDNGLEWVGRFVLEPRRLWKRYLVGNPLFIYRVLRERFSS